MPKRLLTGRADLLRRLRQSPLVADSIPLPLRILDLTLVILALPIAVVVGALLAVAVFLDSPGPVLYRSRRIGRGGRPFAMLKFRTMVRNAAGPLLSAHGDERFTPLGGTLARSRLDELPQLWNVLRGEMRLVGPRPEVEEFVLEFPDEYERILSVPPGLTGPAQVEYAWEGEVLARAQAVDRARVYRESILPLKLAIDLRYAERHHVRGDLVLLARTAALPAVRAWRRLNGALGTGGSQRRLATAALTMTAIIVLVGLLASEGSAAFEVQRRPAAWRAAPTPRPTATAMPSPIRSSDRLIDGPGAATDAALARAARSCAAVRPSARSSSAFRSASSLSRSLRSAARSREPSDEPAAAPSA